MTLHECGDSDDNDRTVFVKGLADAKEAHPHPFTAPKEVFLINKTELDDSMLIGAQYC